MKPDESRIVKEGIWLYDGTIPCRVVIVREDVFPGTGDYEDPPDIQSDRSVPCVQVWFENPAKKGNFNAGGGHSYSVEEAITALKSKLHGNIEWKT